MAISNGMSSYYYTRSRLAGKGFSHQDDIRKEIEMHPNSVFTSEYSLYYYYDTLASYNNAVSPKDIMYFEMHSRHLIPEYREFLFNKLLEINMYKKKIGQDYNLPSKLSKKYQELLSWYETWDMSAIS